MLRVPGRVWTFAVVVACAAILVPAGAAAGDTTPPSISALAVSPPAVDTSTDPAVVTVTATITDAGSPCSAIECSASGVPTFTSLVRLKSPSGKQTTAGTFVALGGDRFSAKVKIAAHAETGTWTVYYVYLKDAAGNYRYVYSDELATLGLGLEIDVSGIPDATPPTVAALALSPATVDTGSTPAVATATATITDDLAGVNDTTDPCSISCYGTTQIGFVSPSGRQFAGGQFTNIGGGRYVETLHFPAHSESGTWTVNTLDLIDTAGNERFLFAGDLQLAGLPVTIAVVNTDAPPPTIVGAVSPAAPDGRNGWYVSAPTVGFTCSAASGVSSCLVDGSSSSSTTLGESASAQNVSGTVIANSGATVQTSVTGLHVDLSPPQVACQGAPFFFLGDPAATVAASVADSASGPEAVTVGAPVSTATAGSFTVSLTGRDLAGNSTTVSCPYSVRGLPAVATLTTFQTQPSFPVYWNPVSGDASIESYDVRYQSADTGSSFGAWVTWQSATTATTDIFTGSPGTTYCFSVRARDAAGNVTPWSAYKCTAVPIDDQAATTAGNWQSVSGVGYFLGTASVSSSAGDTLTLTGVQAKRIGILATKCRGCGTIQVFWNGTLLAQVSLNAATTMRASLVQSTAFTTLQTGTLTVRIVSSGVRSEIDGFAVTQRFT